MFKDILRELREKKGVNQSDIAELFNVKYTTISNWENGISKPSIDQLKVLSKYFNVSTDYLLGADENINPIEKLRQALKEAGLYNGDNDMSEEDFKKALRIVEMLKKDTK